MHFSSLHWTGFAISDHYQIYLSSKCVSLYLRNELVHCQSAVKNLIDNFESAITTSLSSIVVPQDTFQRHYRKRLQFKEHNGSNMKIMQFNSSLEIRNVFVCNNAMCVTETRKPQGMWCKYPELKRRTTSKDWCAVHNTSTLSEAYESNTATCLHTVHLYWDNQNESWAIRQFF